MESRAGSLENGVGCALALLAHLRSAPKEGLKRLVHRRNFEHFRAVNRWFQTSGYRGVKTLDEGSESGIGEFCIQCSLHKIPAGREKRARREVKRMHDFPPT